MGELSILKNTSDRLVDSKRAIKSVKLFCHPIAKQRRESNKKDRIRIGFISPLQLICFPMMFISKPPVHSMEIINEMKSRIRMLISSIDLFVILLIPVFIKTEHR